MCQKGAQVKAVALDKVAPIAVIRRASCSGRSWARCSHRGLLLKVLSMLLCVHTLWPASLLHASKPLLLGPENQVIYIAGISARFNH